jgi:hypothetical protein
MLVFVAWLERWIKSGRNTPGWLFNIRFSVGLSPKEKGQWARRYGN